MNQSLILLLSIYSMYNKFNYDDKNINSYGKILIQDGFELKNNKTKFATNGKCVNVLGIELNNKKCLNQL